MKKFPASATGIVFGSIALLLALVHFWAGPFSPQEPIEVSIAEKAVAIRDATISALKGETVETTTRYTWDADKVAQTVASVFGGLAIVLSAVALFRREPRSGAIGSAMLGGGAIAFQFVGMALGVIVVCIILAVVLSAIGFDFG